MTAATDRSAGPARAPENPYLQGAFAPVDLEQDAELRPVEGEIPPDLCGVFLRNGPNPVLPPRGRYHWFDGDGMVHAVAFRDGQARYRNRWLPTEGLAAERAAGRSLWPGYMERPDPSAPPGAGSDGWLKDTANTDLVFHAGRVLALWYQCGLPYGLDPETLVCTGPETFGGRLPRSVSAHAKVDPVTGELVFFDYATRAPYLTHAVVSADGRTLSCVDVDLPAPRLPHDMAITERYSVLMDLPLFWDPSLLPRGIHRLGYHDDLPSRFAVLPRHGGPDDVRWFEAEPGYIYHVVNAWEEDEAIVMVACKVVDPGMRHTPVPEGPLGKMLATLRLDARLHRWRFDLRTGQTREEPLDDRNAEFPSVDNRVLGRRGRYGYLVRIADTPTLLFDGLIRVDLETGAQTVHALEPGWYASEAHFAPRAAGADEDDGYLVTIVTNAAGTASEARVLDARQLDAAPVARLPLPARVPIGFHACWVEGDALGWRA